MNRGLGAVLLALAAVGLAGCGHAAQSPAAATSAWAKANSNQFAQGVTTLFRDAKWVHDAIAGHDAGVTARTYCLYLYTDAEGENTDLLPSPDDQLTHLLSVAYDGFVQAAAVCDEHVASSLALKRVDAEVARSVTELTEAALREEAVTGTSLRIHGIP